MCQNKKSIFGKKMPFEKGFYESFDSFRLDTEKMELSLANYTDYKNT